MDLNREYSNKIEVPFYQTVAKVLLELYIFIGIICLIVGIFITIHGNNKKTSENKSDDKIESSVGIFIIILSITSILVNIAFLYFYRNPIISIIVILGAILSIVKFIFKFILFLRFVLENKNKETTKKLIK